MQGSIFMAIHNPIQPSPRVGSVIQSEVPVEGRPTASQGTRLDQIRRCLETGSIEEALRIAKKNEADPDMRNAIGVCQMRLGYPERAIAIYRTLTLASCGVIVKPGIPDKYKINFATAHLLNGHVPGCKWMLNELTDRNSPAANRLREAIARWKKSLSIWERFNFVFGGEPKNPILLDLPFGEV
jgi:hypothetical protein